eukprot:14450803-Alexandrium_andersonii.AAC.1
MKHAGERCPSCRAMAHRPYRRRTEPPSACQVLPRDGPWAVLLRVRWVFRTWPMRRGVQSA